jgi:PTS system ascorbate-specific IIA component
MIGILVVAHGAFGENLIENVTHVLGQRPERLSHARVDAGDKPDQIAAKINRSIAALDDGDGVLVLSDICGATPCNVATELLGQAVEMVAGVNLPMLLRTLSYRDLPLESVVEKAIAGGREGVMRIVREVSEAKHATSAS